MDRESAIEIATAIRAAGDDIERGLGDVGHFYLSDEQWEMLPRAIGAMVGITEQGMRRLAAAIEPDDGCGGVVDGLFAIANSLGEVAQAIKSHGEAGRG